MKKTKFYLYANLLFIFVFLNAWDFVINKTLFNGMILGIIMFVPICFLWFLKHFRAVVLITLLSIFEFMVMMVFVWEGFELSGASYSFKSVFWLPFLFAAGLNGFWGLKIYSDAKEKFIK